ncbi:glycosyltransferase family 4 protein [Planctomicrobium sp. SH664]|uniref:glycosyltransferase family 4 protein n=1 Tax=Planctomicrobium sp. SH664 TaxID=3448125 RepID=UPI003F5B6B59
MSRTRVLLLTSGRNTPTTRYRMLPYVPRLAALGIDCTVAHSLPEKYDSFRWLGWRLSQRLKRSVRQFHLRQAQRQRYDAILLEREIFDDPTWELEAAFRQCTPRFVMDIDDAIFLRYPEKFQHIAGMSDRILAGNRFLAEVCRPYCDEIRLLPTCIDLHDYPVPSPTRKIESPAVIGWIGTPSNVPYLNDIVPVLRRLRQRQPLILRIVSHSAAARKVLIPEDLPVEFVEWNARTAVAEISRFTVGLMPLHNGDWERYKCGFKLLQYLASGLPAVASPVGVNAEIVTPGENGFLAASPEDWFETIGQILQDPQLREKLGRNARRTVEELFSIDGHVSTVAAALRD